MRVPPDVVKSLEIVQAVRFLGTDRVMVSGPQEVQLRPLQGKAYSEIRDQVLELSSERTKFYHHRTLEDHNQPVEKKEVSRDGW